jgi:hypothetical protein
MRTPSKQPDEVHGRAAAAWISGGMGLGFLVLGVAGAGAPAYALVACHVLVTLSAVLGPRHLSDPAGRPRGSTPFQMAKMAG